MAFTEESCFCTVNEKYSDPFEEIMLELTFCRYPMRHVSEVVDGVGEVATKGAAEGAAEVAPELAAEGAAKVAAKEEAAEEAAEVAVEGAVEGTFVLVFQV